jgi:hypothetical protein
MLSGISQRYDPTIRRIQRKMPQVLEQHGLPAVFKQWQLAQASDLVLLICTIDDDWVVAQGGNAERRIALGDYHRQPILHDISTILDNQVKVIPSNSTGLRYLFVLDDGGLTTLPRQIELPDVERGKLLIGVTQGNRPVVTDWSRHLMVAGMTGSGKSAFQRSVVYQALAEGFRLALVDPQTTTFPMLENHPALIAPLALNVGSAYGVLEAVVKEMERRAELYRAMPGYPETLPEYNALARERGLPTWPRLLLALEEYNDLVTALGGPDGAFARLAVNLTRVGRKWGVTVMTAAQEWTVKEAGALRKQCETRLCFKVRDRQTSTITVDTATATKLTTPGRAILSGVGRVQTYWVEKEKLIEAGRNPVAGPRLTDAERRIGLASVKDHGGGLNIEMLASLAIREREGRRLTREWDERGWSAKDPARDNKRYLTADFLKLLGAG